MVKEATSSQIEKTHKLGTGDLCKMKWLVMDRYKVINGYTLMQ